MSTETEKTDPSPGPAPIPAALPSPAAESPTSEAKPAAPPSPAPAPPGRGSGGKPKKKPNSPGGMPNRRIVDPVPMLKENFGNPPKLDDIDAEIAGELEAALGGLNQTDMIAGSTSREVRKEATAGGDQNRKKGKILAIHGPDVFIDVPGGRGQGVMSMMQFGDEPPKIGDEVEFSIEGFDGANG